MLAGMLLAAGNVAVAAQPKVELRDPHGRPLRGVPVMVRDAQDGERRLRTDLDGRVELPPGARIADLRIDRPGRAATVPLPDRQEPGAPGGAPAVVQVDTDLVLRPQDKSERIGRAIERASLEGAVAAWQRQAAAMSGTVPQRKLDAVAAALRDAETRRKAVRGSAIDPAQARARDALRRSALADDFLASWRKARAGAADALVEAKASTDPAVRAAAASLEKTFADDSPLVDAMAEVAEVADAPVADLVLRAVTDAVDGWLLDKTTVQVWLRKQVPVPGGSTKELTLAAPDGGHVVTFARLRCALDPDPATIAAGGNAADVFVLSESTNGTVSVTAKAPGLYLSDELTLRVRSPWRSVGLFVGGLCAGLVLLPFMAALRKAPGKEGAPGRARAWRTYLPHFVAGVLLLFAWMGNHVTQFVPALAVFDPRASWMLKVLTGALSGLIGFLAIEKFVAKAVGKA